LLLGQLVSFNGSDTLNGDARFLSASLAINEMNDTTQGNGGILSSDGCTKRPLVLIACDDSNSPLPNDAGTESRDNAATHLTKDLAVEGIIGPENSANTIDVFTHVGVNALTVLMPGSSSSVDIDTIEGGTQQGVRLIWRMVPDDSFQTKAMAEFYTAVVSPRVTNTPQKVAIVYRSDAYGVGGYEYLTGGAPMANLQVNGASFNDPSNAGNTLALEYDYTKAIPASLVQQALAFQPDVMIVFGQGEVSVGLVAPFEDQNNGVTDGGVPEGGTTIGKKPQYILTTSGERADLLNVIAARPGFGLQQRIQGTSSLLITALTQSFYNVRYLNAYPDGGNLLAGMPGTYDSAYMLAYAIQSQNPANAAVPAINVGKGLTQVVTGATQVDVGPSSFNMALGTLQKGQAIKFNGASGPCNFTPATGQEQGDYTMFCVRTDPNSMLPTYQNNTGMTWSYMSDSLVGTYVCQ
jgi:ABC-type branched-subunit amino acid transport system substrate-binding protein